MDKKQEEQLREEFLSILPDLPITKHKDIADIYMWFVSKLEEQERLMEEAIEEADLIFMLIEDGYFANRREIRISDFRERLKSKFLKNNHDTKD